VKVVTGQLTQAVRQLRNFTMPDIHSARADLSSWQQRNAVKSSSAMSSLRVTVSNEREREHLRKLRDQFRSIDASAVDWLALGDGFAAAGLFRDAQSSHEQAAQMAEVAADAVIGAEAFLKAFRDACEQEKWDVALNALNRSIALDPTRYRLFPPRYQPIAILGAGGFGAVFHCKDRYRNNEDVAIKTLYDNDLERGIDAIFGEANLLRTLNHPHIIRVEHHAFADEHHEQQPYLVLEYFSGLTLETYLREFGTLKVEELLPLASMIASAVHAAHQAGVLHRDLKPANILVRREDANWQVKVIDFGLAVRHVVMQTSMAIPSANRSLSDRSFAGTLRYAPPEQKGELSNAVGPYSDVYSFGKMCFEALFGHTEPGLDELGELPADFAKLLSKCVAYQPTKRFADFGTVLDGLRGKPVPKTVPPIAGNAEEQLRRLDELAAENLRRWQASPQPREWAKSHRGGWNHAQWTALVNELRVGAFWPMRDAEIGKVIEAAQRQLIAEETPPVEKRKPGDIYTMPIVIAEPEMKAGASFTLSVKIDDPAIKPGQTTTLTWNTVPTRKA